MKLAPLATGSIESVLVTVRSGDVGVAVGVNVLVGVKVAVAVGVMVGVEVSVGVAVAVGVNVAVGVDVNVAVGVDVNVAVAVAVNVGVCVAVAVGVAVGVAVAVAVAVGVGVDVAVAVGVLVVVGVTVAVAVAVGVLVAVGVGVEANTLVNSVAELFDSSDSTTMSAGSTTATLLTVSSMADVRWPVIVMMANAPAPVPNEPRSQSRVPPVVGPTMAQLPLVVVKPTNVKFDGGVSTSLTPDAPAEPIFLTSIV